MGQLQYPHQKEIKGPWLINQEDFENLDKVILKIDSFLKQSWKSQIKTEVYSDNSNLSEEELEILILERENRPFGNEHEKKCRFKTKDEHILSDSELIGLLKDSSLKTLSPKEFHANIVHGDYHNKFDFRISDSYNELRYEIECFDSNIKEEIQYEIDKWIDKLKPNRALQFWSNYGDFFVYTLFAPLIVLAIFSFFINSYSTYSDVLRGQAYEIINHGIDSTNRDEAIELLLKSESGYAPRDFVSVKKPKNPLFMRLLIIGIFVYVVSIIRPKTTIGVGKMKQKLIFYKFWIKFVTITLPTILIIAPFWKTITNWLY